MHIVLLEPFYTGSHKAWAEQLAKHSRHTFTILSMEGKFWKWRMHGGAVTMARRLREENLQPDLILATDMLDLSTFLGLTRDITAGIPLALYFHENQMAYPWGEQIVRNNNWRHYAFINYASALSADQVFFNSPYHFRIFHQEAYELLKCYPDNEELETVESIKRKSSVLPLGLDLQAFDPYQPNEGRQDQPPLVLWNHRWEHDKNPEEFARLLLDLHQEGYDFQVAFLGEAPAGSVEPFDQLKATLGDRIVQFGYADSFVEYAGWLWQADILPVTSNQDFFGGSVVEAIYCGCYPLLPNRLAYPDHVPEGETWVLYDGYDELLDKTRQLLSSSEKTRAQSFQQWVKGYDWEAVIEQYDRAFEGCVASVSSV